jgi:hypothetical protein
MPPSALGRALFVHRCKRRPRPLPSLQQKSNPSPLLPRNKKPEVLSRAFLATSNFHLSDDGEQGDRSRAMSAITRASGDH